MEEEKAAAYYKDVSDKGSGAARFKQGLGFNSTPSSSSSSSSLSSPPPPASAFLTNFVKASSPSHSAHLHKQSQILNIQNKLKKKKRPTSPADNVRVSSRDRDRRRAHSDRGRDDDDDVVGTRRKGIKDGNRVVVDYANLIHGYIHMTPAEKVKAKMKLQLSLTAEKDEKMGAGSNWERFEFNKDAPVEDEELEAADDDAAVSKRIGQSFRFASMEGKREDEIKNAHDEAMFGVPASQPSQISESEDESENEDKLTNDTKADQASSLLNEKVLTKQQGSWRDRARRKIG